MRAFRFVSVCLIGGLALGGCAAHSTTSSNTVSASDAHFVYEDPVVNTKPARRGLEPATANPGPLDLPALAAERTPATTNVTTPSALEVSLRELREAITVDAAVDAYASGLAVDNTSVALHKAYVRKVVDLDAPSLGVAAAQKVLAAEPNNGLARAVLAYSESQQNAMVDAMTDISIAARRVPDEPFVQRTAAHLIAWYENNPQPPTLPASVRDSLPRIRTDLNARPAFAAAYRDASNFFRDEHDRIARADGAAATQPSTQPAGGVTIAPPADRPDFAGYTGADIGYSAVPRDEPSVVNNYYYDYPYAYGWPYGYGYGWGLGFGFGAGVAFYDSGFHHHHFDHRHWGNVDHGFRNRFFGDRHDAFGLTRGGSNFSSGNLGFVPPSGAPGTTGGFGNPGLYSGANRNFGGAYRGTVPRSSFGRGGFGSGRAGGGFRGAGGGFRGGGGFHGGGGGGHR